MNKNILMRGFTLIELLVVIAIIGILAAVVLASLNDARNSGQDASIKQEIGNARSQAEIVYNQSNYTYSGVCTDPKITTQLNAIRANRSLTGSVTVNGASSGTAVTCNSTDDGYAIHSPLNVQVGSSTAWCVDSSGFAGLTGNNALSGNTDVICS